MERIFRVGTFEVSRSEIKWFFWLLDHIELNRKEKTFLKNLLNYYNKKAWLSEKQLECLHVMCGMWKNVMKEYLDKWTEDDKLSPEDVVKVVNFFGRMYGH